MSADGLVTISLTPVVYTEGAGPDGPDELLAPPTPRVGTYDLPVAVVPEQSGPTQRLPPKIGLLGRALRGPTCLRCRIPWHSSRGNR